MSKRTTLYTEMFVDEMLLHAPNVENLLKYSTISFRYGSGSKSANTPLSPNLEEATNTDCWRQRNWSKSEATTRSIWTAAVQAPRCPLMLVSRLNCRRGVLALVSCFLLGVCTTSFNTSRATFRFLSPLSAESVWTVFLLPWLISRPWLLRGAETVHSYRIGRCCSRGSNGKCNCIGWW